MGRIVLADSFGSDANGIPIIELLGMGEAILGDPSVWSYIGFTAEQISALYVMTQDSNTGEWSESQYTPKNPRVVLSYLKLPDEADDFKISTLSPLMDTSSNKIPDQNSLTGASKLAVAWAEAWRGRLSYLYNERAQVALFAPPSEGLLYATSADWKSKDGSLGSFAEIIQKCPKFTAGAGTLVAVYNSTTNSTYLYLLLSHFIPAPPSSSADGTSSSSANEFISPLLPNFDTSLGGPIVGMWTALWWVEPECLVNDFGGAVPKVAVTYLSGPRYKQYLPSESGKGVRWALIADSSSYAPIMARRVDADILRTPTQRGDTEMLWLSGFMSHRFTVLRDGDTEVSVFEILI